MLESRGNYFPILEGGVSLELSNGNPKLFADHRKE
jgi:hypothetical protein